jgi:hypothetical protein
MKLNIEPKIKVLPCPFCGSKKIKFDRMVSVLECHNRECSAQMYHPHFYKAVKSGKTQEQIHKDIIELWNKRYIVS